jgi:hypothetical protein
VNFPAFGKITGHVNIGRNGCRLFDTSLPGSGPLAGTAGLVQFSFSRRELFWKFLIRRGAAAHPTGIQEHRSLSLIHDLPRRIFPAIPAPSHLKKCLKK